MLQNGGLEFNSAEYKRAELAASTNTRQDGRQMSLVVGSALRHLLYARTITQL